MNVALRPFERRWAHAVLETMFPGPDRGALPLGIVDLDLDGFLDETLSETPVEASIGLRLALWVIALAPLFVMGRPATIASLPVGDRERVIGALAASPVYVLRSTVLALKAIGALLYCGDPVLRPLMLGRQPAPAGGGVIALRLRAPPPAPAAQPAAARAPVAPGAAAPPASTSSPSSKHGAEHEPRTHLA